MHRLFVAIDLPSDVTRELDTICFGIPGAKWVAKDQLHLTLRFIGEVDGGQFKDIREILSSVHMEPFPVKLKGVGHFPPRKKPRVVWVGIEKNAELVRLRNKIESLLVRGGLKPEGRKYAPHITLARLKDTPTAKVGSYFGLHGLFECTPFTVNTFYLYSSSLTPKGAIHRQEAAYALTTP